MFGCDGFAANVVIIAAAELAYKDGMDVINLCAAQMPTAAAATTRTEAKCPSWGHISCCC